MQFVRTYFPLSFRGPSLKDMLISILIYIVLDIVCGLIIGLLGALPLIGWLFAIVGWVAGIYFFVGIIIAVLNFLKVFNG